MHVAYYAPFAQRTGYAQAAHDYMLALHRAGVSLQIIPLIDCDPDDLDERYADLLPLAMNPPAKAATHVIVHTVPGAVPMFLKGITKDITTIAITTWETKQAPQNITKALGDACDAIIVPSVFCGEALGEARADIHLVPHCFDPEHWPVSEVPPADSPYMFYSVLSWNERKNPIGLIKAYIAEFSSDDDVLLRIKANCNRDDIADLARASGIPPNALPAIDLCDSYLDHEEMVDFHQENHCFVTAARGEGWNLPAFEAALCGRPVISHDFGGQMEYLSYYPNYVEYGHTLTPAIVPPVVEAPIEIAGLKIMPVTRTAPSGITARQHWAEPDLSGLQKAMRACYEDRARVDNSARKSFEDKYSYATIGAQLANLLERTTK